MTLFSLSGARTLGDLVKQSASGERCTEVRHKRPAFGVGKTQGVKTIMSLLRLTAERSMAFATQTSATRKRSEKFAAVTRLARFAKPLVAAVLAGLLAGGPASPVFAQQVAQEPTQEPAQNPPQTPAPATPEGAASTPLAAPIPVSLGVSKYKYSHPPRPFPNLLNPYKPIQVAPLGLSNSPRIDQLIHDNKLEISLQDAVELALENSMDIAVARYNPWFADTDVMATEAGAQPFGISGAAIRQSFANIPFLNLDPTFTTGMAFDDRSTAINNPFIAGTGTASATGLISHTSTFNNQYSQGFTSGTTVTATWDNSRSSSSSAANFFNPSVTSSLTISFQQQLLNGFGFFVNRRNIVIAKNNRKLADYVFEQQAITTVTNTITAYWELVYARENVKVQEQAVTVSNKLYNDTRKQLEIGTLAPLDVTRTESQLATDQQNLIIAQTTKLQDEQVLKNAISKDPLATNLINVEIVPTELPAIPGAVEAASFEDAIKEAFTKRPELLQQEINVKNAAVDTRATRLALLPTATLTAQYTSAGLAGNSPVITGTTTTKGANIVDATGQPVTVLDTNGMPVEIFEPSTTTTTSGAINHQGFGTAQSQIFHNQFPDYLVALNLQIPIRNRAAQSTNQHAILTQRQLEAQQQQLKNAALLDVRNTYIALQQDRAQVQAASKARELQQQTFSAEQKRYQLGASTVYNVILTQRDLISAQGAEVRALANLVEAKANYERAVGRTLEVNRVTIADAKHGVIEHETLIPGTLNGQVVGTDKIFTNSGQR
jgi:outer membrane protein